MKPLLRWAGGKTQLLPELRKRVPEKFGTYHEPFFGGGALFFDLLPKKAVLSDDNIALIDMYVDVQCAEWRVDRALEEHRKNHCFDHYLKVRERFGAQSPSAAADFIYLNKACFNGLWRVNKSGKFNVPYGKLKNVCLPDPEELIAYRDALNGARIYADHFSFSMNRPVKGDFVYCDPPYIPRSATSNFSAYTSNGFDETEHICLRDRALNLKDRGVHVLLSNSDTQLAWDLYSKGFKIEVVQVRRAIDRKSVV